MARQGNIGSVCGECGDVLDRRGHHLLEILYVVILEREQRASQKELIWACMISPGMQEEEQSSGGGETDQSD
jgi:hypothetical protein